MFKQWYYNIQFFIVDYVSSYKTLEQSILFLPTYLANGKLIFWWLVITSLLVWLQNKMIELQKQLENLSY